MDFQAVAESDRERWDRFVGLHPTADFCQAWAWGQVKGRGEWTPLRYGLFAAGELVGAAQLLQRRLPGGSLLYASRGPIVDWADPGAVPALVAGLRQVAREQRAVCVKLDPCLGKDAAARLRQLGLTPLDGGDGRFGGTQPRYVMRLDLRPGLEQVFAGFKADYRNRIRKAERRGVAVRFDDSPEDWDRFFALLTSTADRQAFTIRAASYFAAIREELTGACEARLILAESGGEMVAAILCVAYGHTVWYLYGGMNELGRKDYAGYLVQWRAMEWAAAKGCQTYDFRGVAAPEATDSPLYGLNRFKEGFGPELVEWVGEWDLVTRPLAYRAFTWLLPRARQLLGRRR